MTQMQQLSNAQASPEVPINENFETLSASAIYGKRQAVTTGLTWGFYGGLYNGNTAADGTVTLTDNATNYIVVLRSTGVVSVSTSTTNGANALYAKLYTVTTVSGAVTTVVDQRQDANGLMIGVPGTAITIDTDGTLAANSDTVVASQKATRTYVDGKLAGLSWKQGVRAATTANGTLGSAYANGSAIDGVTLATGNRILIKNQTTASENGIYTVNATGAPTRATDADSGAELVNASCYVSEGSTLADTQWTCTTDAPITPGTTSLAFAQFTGTTVDLGTVTHGYSAKTTPVDADEMLLSDSAATNFGKKVTWANAKATLRTPSIQAVTSAATVTPTFLNDLVKITAQAAALTLANPTGTAIDGLGMAIRIKDNATARAITYGTQYRAVGVTLPTTTVVSKTLYLGLVFNNDDTKWDVVAVAQEV